MESSNRNPKLIATNGIYLVLRMLFVLFLSFYITRLALAYLGDEDFGINDVVGGITVIFAIITMPLTNTVQRFLNVEFVRQKYDPVVVFSTCRRLIYILSIILIVLYETIGLYLINYVIKIPDGKMWAANVVYQISIVTSLASLMYLPYQSLMYSRENMKICAYAEMGLSIFRLVMLIVLPCISVNHLIGYALILCFGYSLIFLFYYVYSKTHYTEIVSRGRSDMALLKNILGFSGWNLLESVSGIVSTYGTNIIINIFGGVLYNTAYGISKQISHAVTSFTINVLKAVEPQITSSHVENNISYRDNLLMKAISSSFLMIGFIYVIFWFSGELVLKLWLVKTPAYTLDVIRFTLLACVFTGVVLPLRCLILATGQIKEYFIGILTLTLVSISLMYFLLIEDMSVVLVFAILLGLEILKFLLAILVVKLKINFKASRLFITLLKCITGLTLLFFMCKVIYGLPISEILHMMISIITGFVILLGLIAFITFNKVERKKIINHINSWKRR